MSSTRSSAKAAPCTVSAAKRFSNAPRNQTQNQKTKNNKQLVFISTPPLQERFSTLNPNTPLARRFDDDLVVAHFRA
ncbi:predicted protein [Ostreococcus lucimarinus CCE9901]|uniref:Uncharacterized protein n=1 Tax=Ostreococcus lucimarinus (strain CCE9901) TaxID=436017 RepID=A4RS63_OSTLU|nr:predicted protein [Ostreococcus lucimarinus CCE9901]ABO93978.1 predicted protein [Ostreococcus lucimarinus CCE9901]|eukprot:XP_001415686.1 predicted protein [Ostreococcus lucimarinus CCE9901]